MRAVCASRPTLKDPARGSCSIEDKLRSGLDSAGNPSYESNRRLLATCHAESIQKGAAIVPGFRSAGGLLQPNGCGSHPLVTVSPDSPDYQGTRLYQISSSLPGQTGTRVVGPAWDAASPVLSPTFPLRILRMGHWSPGTEPTCGYLLRPNSAHGVSG